VGWVWWRTGGDLGGILVTQRLEDKQAIKDIQHFVIMLVKGHLQIETHKLGQVAMCLRVFRTED
jgi:hypothetical protein